LIKIIFAVLILLLLFGGTKHLAKLKSAKTLNLADRFLSMGQGARKIADGQPYGRQPRQMLDIWAPATVIGPLPVVIFYYGGGWENGNRADYGFVGRALAAQGFLVVIPDYSLTPKAHFPDFVEDCALAAAWMQEHAAAFGGDPARIALMGHSAGAYNAAMIALDEQWMRRAGGNAHALRGVATLAGPFDFLPMTKGGQAERAMGRYRPLTRTQPINFVRPDAPPFWLASGADDEMVAARNSKVMAAALQDVGAAATLQLYPNLNHAGILMALSQPFRGKGDILQDVTVFLTQATAPHSVSAAPPINLERL
jgi:acetyl esterase/lipase